MIRSGAEVEFDALFGIEDEDKEEFYDFTKDVQDVEFEIGFDSLRSLQNVCLLPNLDLIIEGNILSEQIEIYKIEEDSGVQTEPFMKIHTGLRGLNAVAFDEYVIYMGFMGSLQYPNLAIQVYNREYEHLQKVEYPLSGNCFTDLILMMDGRYLIGAHNGGIISVYDADDFTVELFEEPFGYVDTIWSLEQVGENDTNQKSEYFVAATTDGLYVCSINEDGKITNS